MFWELVKLSWLRICLQCGRSQFDSWVGKIPGEGIGYTLQYFWTSLVAQLVKNPPAMHSGYFPDHPHRKEKL